MARSRNIFDAGGKQSLAVTIVDQDTQNQVSATVADVTAAGTLGALNNAVTLDLKGGVTSVAYEIDTGLAGSTVLVEGTLDDTNWFTENSVTELGTVRGSLTTTGVRGKFASVGWSQARLRVSVYGSGSSAARLRGSYSAPGPLMIYGLGAPTPPADATAAGSMGTLQVFQMAWNGASWDRVVTVQQATFLASAARTTTQTQADQANHGHRGIRVTLDMTVVGTGSVTLEIDIKDPTSGKYVSLLTGAAVVGNGTTVYTVYPGATPAANVAANAVLGQTWRLLVTANNANSATYSVGYELLI